VIKGPYSLWWPVRWSTVTPWYKRRTNAHAPRPRPYPNPTPLPLCSVCITRQCAVARVPCALPPRACALPPSSSPHLACALLLNSSTRTTFLLACVLSLWRTGTVRLPPHLVDAAMRTAAPFLASFAHRTALRPHSSPLLSLIHGRHYTPL
jgi:hypothetical protein